MQLKRITLHILISMVFGSVLLSLSNSARAQEPTCKRVVRADVVALDQAFYNNRLGAFQAGGMIFALRRDVVSNDSSTAELQPGKVMLRPDKRPRPIVLRVNVGDCLDINFQNLLAATAVNANPPVKNNVSNPSTQPATRYAGVHVMGMQVVSASVLNDGGSSTPVDRIGGDGSWVGANGIFENSKTSSGVVGPGSRINYRLYAAAEGAYLLYSTASNLGLSPDFGGQLSEGLFGTVTVQPETAEAYRSQVTRDDLSLATLRSGDVPANSLTPKLDNKGQQETVRLNGKTFPLWLLATKEGEVSQRATVIIMDDAGNAVPPPLNGFLKTPDGHPIVNYDARYAAGSANSCKPVLKMIDQPYAPTPSGNCGPVSGRPLETFHTDLTAIVTGPNAGRFPYWVQSPSFNENPAMPDRRQPYREFVIHYHDDFTATQAFSAFQNTQDPLQYTLRAGRDFFAINYGMGGIGPEVWANRTKVGPMYQCVTCKFEEFFLSSWPNGDPAMIVDVPANAVGSNNQVISGPKATKALYPDDPSNVYHSYIKDHVKFRVLHAGTNITHVHHQHAHQWLHTPDSDESHYRDSQMISPGAAYTLEQVYNGSGNLNQVVGDSIFHCHFYPHFAQGMWALWRTHDVFEEGTELFKKGDTVIGKGGKPIADPSGMAKPGARALPDGEIAVELNDGSWAAGTAIPAIVPMPSVPMAPLPAKVKVVPAMIDLPGPAPKQTVQIDGAVVDGKVVWTLNGAPLQNNSKINVKAGDTVTFAVQSGFHGVTFLDKAQAQQAFDFGQPAVPFQAQPNIVPNAPYAWGTPGKQAGTVLATLTVKPTPAGITSIPFICTIHKLNMAGTFELGPVSNDVVATVGFKAEVAEEDLKSGKNPGFPFFIPGVAGQRAPHPPLDFAKEEDDNGKLKVDENGNNVYLDGGLPRFLALFDVGTYQKQNRWDFSKDNHSLTAVQLPEEGTPVEKVAMAAHSTRAHSSFTPEGTPGNFILNGLPPVSGAPYANPGIDLYGNPISTVRRYKAANIQLDLVLNKKGWHFPQGRILSLWGDVKDTMEGNRRPEPFFFRANTGEVIEYWHANLVPNYYELDDFQVRTPTDILGQHIHLVKFDVTSSDGAGNGFNYEDGTLSSQEVREQIENINRAGGLWSFDMKSQTKLAPKRINELCGTPLLDKECVGAQATIQRWYADPQLNNAGIDKTLRTVFTHDHFGPSTHQQAGLYAGLVIEPQGSRWFTPSGVLMGSRSDGGPTSWHANIISAYPEDSYREFLLEFQDDALSYYATSRSTSVPYKRYSTADPPQTPWGWADPTKAVNPQTNTDLVITGRGQTVPAPPNPLLVTNAFLTGTYSVNYSNEPLAFRVGVPPNDPDPIVNPAQTDLSSVFRSIPRTDRELNRQPAKGTPINPNCSGPDCFRFPAPQPGALPTDPYTPLLRAYEGDKVQIRVLVGAHQAPHAFNLQGLKWRFEPNDKNSGYRSTQGMGISEHYEMLFDLPRSGNGQQADYQWATSSDVTGLQNGNWGILRAYNRPQPDLKPLPNNPFPGIATQPTTQCAPNAYPRHYAITATTSSKALNKQPVVYNSRGASGTPGRQQIASFESLLFVHSDDLENGVLKPGVPVEPLVIRAAAGDCISITLTNDLPAQMEEKNLNGGTSNTRPFVYPLFGFTDTKQAIDQMVFFFSQSKATYDSRFRTQFNRNKFGYKLPADPNDSSVSTTALTAGAVWQITLQSDPNDADATPNTFVVSRVSETQMDIAIGINLSTSREIGLHPQLLSYDITKDNGVNVGLNPIGTVKPNETRTFNWYAGTTEQFSFSVKGSKEQVDKMVFFFSQSQPIYDVEFRNRFNQNSYGFTLPEAPGKSVSIVTSGSIWRIQLAEPEQSFTVAKVSDTEFYITTVKYAPVEFGSVNLTSSDPLEQHPFGLIGALIVEPQGAKWQADINSRASATVTKPDGSQFREFVSVIQDDVTGLVLWTPPSNGGITISGDIFNGKPTWMMNGAPLPSGGVTIKPGQTVTFNIQRGTHGLLFPDEQTAKAVFDIDNSPQKSKFQPLPTACSNFSSGYGVTPQPSGLIATITAKQEITIKSQAFECTQHCQNMTGSFQIGSGGGSGTVASVPPPAPFAINYRTEPINYRYQNNNPPFGVSPTGIARALSNTLVQGDPQTPVFAASSDMPVRFRMLHPAGINEQVWTLHGHVWQEEPYVGGSIEIGNNPKSQYFGSRDAFVANSAFDAVIPKAGGNAGVTGDYLYRTFIGVDFQNGIWGVLRVGEPGQDIVTITTFQQPTQGGSVVLKGVNTVNPSNGQMADSVTVFSGTTVLGTFPVDKMTGVWPVTGQITLPSNITSVTVVSTQGGKAVAPTFVQSVGAAPVQAAPQPDQTEVFKFRPKPRSTKPSNK